METSQIREGRGIEGGGLCQLRGQSSTEEWRCRCFSIEESRKEKESVRWNSGGAKYKWYGGDSSIIVCLVMVEVLAVANGDERNWSGWEGCGLDMKVWGVCR